MQLMTNVFFEREIYNDLVQWVAKSRHALYLEGPRQVGKTELLKKLGREQFKHCVYIDVRLEAKKFVSLMNHHNKAFGRSAFPEEMGEVWEGVFRGFDPSYTNDEHTLVILDEIQESPEIYNSIRYIRRGLKSKLAVSGSYLGIVTQSKEFWISAGDLHIQELSSLSFKEFLKANDIWNEFDKIETFDLSQMTESEKIICEKVRELYYVYCQIGGYPSIVEEWITNKDIDACKKMGDVILRLLYKESSAYFGDVIGGELWFRTLEHVAAHMVTKSGDLDITIAKDSFRNENAKGLEVHRKDKVNALKWLDDCKIIGVVQQYVELDKVLPLSNRCIFYFRDMGIMSRLCENSLAVLLSNLAGMYAENFVYLYLHGETEKLFLESNVRSFNGSWGQMDFIMHDKQRKRYGIEVKHGSGSTRTGDKALNDGKVDYLLRIQDTYGSIGENQTTIPIFMLDKLKYVIK
jgi:hypothetical protein